MAEEEVVAAISAPPVDLKRKLDEIKPELVEQHAGSNGVTMAASDSSQAKRPKLEDEAADGNGKTQENVSPAKFKEEDLREEPKEEESDKLFPQKDENQDYEPLVEQIKELIITGKSENQPADAHVKPEDNQQSYVEAPKSQEDTAEECKDVNGGEPQKEGNGESKGLNDSSFQNEIGKENQEVDGDNSQKEVDDTRSITRRIDVPNSKVGVLIGKGGETIRYLQINSGAKIQILRDSETDPNSALRPVEIIGTVTHIENAENRINAVIVEVGLIIGRGGDTIKIMQTRLKDDWSIMGAFGAFWSIKERSAEVIKSESRFGACVDRRSPLYVDRRKHVREPSYEIASTDADF